MVSIIAIVHALDKAVASLEQAVAAGDLGAIANVATDLTQLNASIAPPYRLDHSGWPPEIRAHIYEITHADIQNIHDIIERDYADATPEERSRVQYELIRKAGRPAPPDREGAEEQPN